MSNQSPSSLLVAFAEDAVRTATSGNILRNAQILDSKWQEITEDKGIVISNAEWDFSPGAGGDLQLYDALMIVGFFYRIPGADTSERAMARDKCFEMAKAFAAAIFNDFTLGGRVCDAQVLRLVDGMDNTNSDSFAIINLPVILNPTGNRDFNLGEAQ